MKIKLKQLKAEAKKNTKVNDKRLDVLLKENEHLRNLHGELNCKKDKKQINEAHKRFITRKRKTDKGQANVVDNKKRKQEKTTGGRDGSGRYHMK